MQRKIAIGVSVTLAVIAVILLWLARSPDDAKTEAPAAAVTAPQGLPSAQEVAAAIEKSKTDTRFKTGRENMPKSLSDTEVDGE